MLLPPRLAVQQPDRSSLAEVNPVDETRSTAFHLPTQHRQSITPTHPQISESVACPRRSTCFSGSCFVHFPPPSPVPLGTVNVPAALLTRREHASSPRGIREVSTCTRYVGTRHLLEGIIIAGCG